MYRLYILNHQPTVPPFMLSALKVAVNQFDEVVYINKRIPTNVEAVPDGDCVKFFELPKRKRVTAYILALFEFFSPKDIGLFIKGVKENGLSFHFLKVFFAHILYFWSAKSTVESLICSNSKEDKTFVLSGWYGAEALCVSRVKQQIPGITAVSLAHSFEIFTSRDPYIQYYFNEEKLKYLDSIYFISKQGYDSFFAEVPGSNRYIEKASVVYLGTYKDNDVLNPLGGNDSFNLCTCSRTIPLKRLDVLCEALRLWDSGSITWTHIGFGEDDERLRQLAKKTEAENTRVKIILKGRLKNEEVINFYANSSVDLFVNLSTIEGLPISIMEVLSFGIPVIATDVGGTREIVNDKVGLLLPSDITPMMVKDAIYSYYSKSDVEIAALRTNAFIQWKTRFNAEHNFNYLFEKMKGLNS